MEFAMRTAISSLLFPALLISFSPTQAVAAPWRTLGTAMVHRAGWRPVRIPVRGRAAASALRLCAEQNRIRFEEARVRFTNNRSFFIHARANVMRGRCTHALWLPGPRRQLSSVEVTTSQPNQRSAMARIRLEGRG
jgi:hypothetical protein